MREQRVWTYRPKRQTAGHDPDLLLAKLVRRGQPSGQPVPVCLADLVADTDLSPREAIASLSSLAQKGLISIFPRNLAK